MKTYPILFTDSMVRALLDGRNTQTRRPMKPQPEPPKPGWYFDAYVGGPFWNWWTADNRCVLPQYRAPYAVGDLLWARETWSFDPDTESGPVVSYKASGHDAQGSRWRPSIHMPRWASRITLRVTGVRVERVQDITTEDRIAEGMVSYLREHDAEVDLREQYRDLWNTFYADPALTWDANPWVWVVSFDVLERNVDDVLQEAAE